MSRLLAALAVVVAFVAGRETAGEVHARPSTLVQREVVTVQAPPVQCPTPPVPAAIEEMAEVEDDPASVDIADTTVVRQLERRALLEANLGSRGALFGIVRDAQTDEPMAGVTIVTNARGAEQVAITDELGYYQITDLDPDTYTVAFYFADTTIERTDIAVAARRSTPLHQKIITHPERGIVIDTDYVKNIPVPGRTFDGEGLSFSSSTTVENEYIVYE